jgi:Spy/CpxP family protein refolding chaperone
MNSSTWICQLTTWFFVFAVCLPMPGVLALAQDIPPAGLVPGGQNAPPVPIMRRASEGAEVQAEELLRALELPAIQKALVLSEEQRKKIEDISFNVRKAVIQQQSVLQVQRLELERMMRADIPDRAAIDKKIPEVVQAMTAIMRARISALLDLNGVLTKEQKEKIREFVSQRIQQAARANMQQAQPGLRLNPPAPPVVAPQPPSPLR